MNLISVRINRLKRKTTILSQKMRKGHMTKFIIHLWKSQHSWNRRKLPRSDKGQLRNTSCWRPSEWRKTRYFSLNQEQSQDVYSHHSYSTLYWSSHHCHKARKSNKVSKAYELIKKKNCICRWLDYQLRKCIYKIAIRTKVSLVMLQDTRSQGQYTKMKHISKYYYKKWNGNWKLKNTVYNVMKNCHILRDNSNRIHASFAWWKRNKHIVCINIHIKGRQEHATLTGTLHTVECLETGTLNCHHGLSWKYSPSSNLLFIPTKLEGMTQTPTRVFRF